MDSWLKRAEDLFEVVDRRAKLVVSELSDEQVNAQKSASNGLATQTTQARRKKSNAKAQNRASIDQVLKPDGDGKEQSNNQISLSDPTPNQVTSLLPENDGDTSVPTAAVNGNKQQDIVNNDSSSVDTSSVDNSSTLDVEIDSAHSEAVIPVSNVETVSQSSNGELGSENAPSSLEDSAPSSASLMPGSDLVDNNHPVDSDQDTKPRNLDDSGMADEENVKSTVDANSSPIKDANSSPINDANSTPINDAKPNKKADESAESVLGESKKQHQDTVDPNKVQEQLDEAQGLLKSTNASGKSKEARLARVCAGLSSRLQEYKSENAQLEELLAAERELSKSYEDRMKQLAQELSASKVELSRVETSMGEALAAKNSEIAQLVTSLDALKKQAVMSEENLASLQANMEALMRNRELSETRIAQALREELATVERRAEEERAAHNTTKMAAMEREVELEQRAVEASTALARVQRLAEERTTKAAEFEQKVALLEVECASLNQELQDMEAKVRRGQKKSPDDANQLIQIQAWQEEVERARQGQRDAESKLSSMEAELQKMRVEMAAMKRDAEHYSRQEHMELEKRYRELTDLLYYKQTQLETMASEKAAAEFQLEKEIKRLHETQAEAERSRVSRRSSSSWEVEETDVKELEPLPLHQRHLAGASTQLRKAAKFLDTGAVRATRFLWRYPTARVSLLCYLVFVHLFLMYLLHRLQEQADDLSAREVAQSMGLAQPNLP